MLRKIGKFIWNFMIIFSFIVNIILVIVLLVAGLLIFDIKNNIAEPLVGGLHSSFVGLHDATIDWTIPVREVLPVRDMLPVRDTLAVNDSIALDQDTIVRLTQPVPLTVSATITLPGVGVLNNAQVVLSLPAGLELPVHLDLDVPVNLQVPIALDVPVSLDVPVNLDVRAVIPLGETQLHDPVENLRLLFEPIVRVLYNLPDDFSEVGPFVADVLDGSPPNLVAEDPNFVPWSGFSETAGAGYDLVNEPVPQTNLPMQTGIVPMGGIPGLDAEVRPDIYAQGGPAVVNAQAANSLSAQGVPPESYNGDYGVFAAAAQAQAQIQAAQETPVPTEETGGTIPDASTPSDAGIITAIPIAPDVGATPAGNDMGIIPVPSG